jgi:branched-subunit amino acid transport protein
MALVTYIPRVIPLTLLSNKKLSPFLKNFLYFIPFAVLGALIFPSMLSSTGDMRSSAVGGTAAVICAFVSENATNAVFGSIIAVIVYKLFFI